MHHKFVFQCKIDMRTELTLPSFLILYSALEIKQKKTGSKSLVFKILLG